MRADAVDAAVAQCRALGARAEGYIVDVTNREAVDAMVAKVRETFGRIDVLVNNAGINPAPVTVSEMPSTTGARSSR